MKKYLYLLLVVFTTVFSVQGQINDPVKWSTSVEKLSETEFNLIIKAEIEPHWHFYSQKQDNDLGPIASEVSFSNPDKVFKLLGETKESKPTRIFEEVFDMKVNYFENQAVFTQKVKVLNAELTSITGAVFYQSCNDTMCLAPTEEEFVFSLNGSGKKEIATVTSAKDEALAKALKINVTGWDNYKSDLVAEKTNFTIFILGFVGGLIALLTPCVFPMIPLTVSFFTKSGENPKKGIFNAVMYGFFILVIYLLLSLPFHFIDSLNPEILNTISTNVYLNVIFFVILVAFSFSFFGYYEITLPSSWGNKMDSASSSIGGVIGVFLMALTLAIVSFSCTGPILGSLLAGSLTSDGGATQLTMGMAGFGLALALPFSLFALFPKWLNALPKSGGWLNSTKVVLGFLELAMAFKFLSNADLVQHWGLLKREVFIGVWIVIFFALFLYLIAKIKFPHDSPISKLSKGRWTFAVLVLAFVVYLLPGLSNTKYANLTLLSGFPPPLPYSLYDKQSECPLDLNCYKDFEEGLEAAKLEQKPIMLDFTGWACVNCRKMEEQVWSQDKVYRNLKDNFIIISLYVDDRKELPKEQQFKFTKPSGGLKTIKTIGDKWATFQTINFQNNSQPHYVLLNHNMELLQEPVSYMPDASKYNQWLLKGLENFK